MYLQQRSLDTQVLHSVCAGQDLQRIRHFSDSLNLFIGLSAHLVEEQVVDVVGEEGAKLALLAGTHAQLHLLNKPAQIEKRITVI